MASGRLKLLKDCEMIFLWVATLEFKQADIVRGHIETSIQLYCVLILTYVGVLSPATWFMIGFAATKATWSISTRKGVRSSLSRETVFLL